MAFPFFTLTNKVPLVGFDPTGAILEAEVAAVPLPSAIEDLGAFVLADTTSIVAAKVQRATTIQVTCPVPATVAPVLDVDAGIESVGVLTSGQGYVRPPVLLAIDNVDIFNTPQKGASFQAYLKLVTGEGGLTRIAAGTGYSARTIVGAVGGLPPGTFTDTETDIDEGADRGSDFLGTLGVAARTVDPPSRVGPNTEACVNFVTVLVGGENYSAETQILFLGAEPDAGGRPPFAFPVIDPVTGAITGVQMVDPGMGFIAPLTAVAFDPTDAGSGAELSVSMMRGRPAALTFTRNVVTGAITSVDLLGGDGGDGYVTVPRIVIFDPAGTGSGAVYTADAVPGGAVAQLGVSRVDVLAKGALYNVAVILAVLTRFEAAYFVALSEGNLTVPGAAFQNLLRTAIQELVATQVTESLS
jgi:hypothetical protein